jgi:hypothetical protein
MSMGVKIIDFPGGAWVAMSKRLDERVARELIVNNDVLLSDLDHTVGRSPAVLSAMIDLKEHITKPRMWTDKRFWSWCIGAGKNLVADLYESSEQGRVRSWVDYYELYLKDEADRTKRGERLSEKCVKKLLYPGVEEFLGGYPDIYKCFLTRNIPEFARPFMDYLGFDYMITDVRDKGKEIARFIEENRFEQYLVAGDFEVMPNLRVLESYYENGTIIKPVSINVASSKRKIDERATINIGRDYRGLVELIRD